MAARCHKRWNAGVAQDLERRASLAGCPPSGGTPDEAPEVLRQRLVVDRRRAREAEELAQRVRVAVEAVAQERVAEALEAATAGSSGTR